MDGVSISWCRAWGLDSSVHGSGVKGFRDKTGGLGFRLRFWVLRFRIKIGGCKYRVGKPGSRM